VRTSITCDLTISWLRALTIGEVFLLVGVVVVTYLSRVAGFLVGLELLRRGGERSSGAVGAFPLTVEEDVVLLTRCGGGAVDLLECLVMVVHVGGGDEAGFDIWASCSFGWGGLVDFDRDGFRLVVWKQGMWLGPESKEIQ
jgi:hypothetical protein